MDVKEKCGPRVNIIFVFNKIFILTSQNGHICILSRRRPTVLLPGRFWHITDLHLDPTYHLSQDPTKVCFSSKGVPVPQAGLYGDFLCDSPYRLIQSAFSHMAPLTKPQDFIIWTGSVHDGCDVLLRQSGFKYESSHLAQRAPVALKQFHILFSQQSWGFYSVFMRTKPLCGFSVEKLRKSLLPQEKINSGGSSFGSDDLGL